MNPQSKRSFLVAIMFAIMFAMMTAISFAGVQSTVQTVQPAAVAVVQPQVAVATVAVQPVAVQVQAVAVQPVAVQTVAVQAAVVETRLSLRSRLQARRAYAKSLRQARVQVAVPQVAIATAVPCCLGVEK